MGVNNLLEELFHGSKQVPQIGRAYFKQSIALVSVCRQIVPHVGFDSERIEQLKRAIDSLNTALECARKAGRQENTKVREALNDATHVIVEYLRVYHDHPTQPDEVIRNINKLLIGSDTDIHAEDKVRGQLAVAEERLKEMGEKDKDAGRQIQHLSQRLKFKLRNLSARTKKVEVWVWPAEVNLNESGVRRQEVVLEEDAILDHVLCQVLDLDKLTLFLTLNPQFYKTFFALNKTWEQPSIEPLQQSTTLSNLRPNTTVSYGPLVLHLVVDRQWRVVLDIANQVQVFGNVIKVRDDVVFLKNKLGALQSAHKLLKNEEPVALYSYPQGVTVQVDGKWFSVVIELAKMDKSCDFLVLHPPPNESALKTLDGNPINRPHQPPPNQSTFKSLEWKPIIRSPRQPPPNEPISKPLEGNPINKLPHQLLPKESTSNTLDGDSINKSLHTKDVSNKKRGHPQGKLQNVAQGVNFIGSDMAPISQNFQQERVQSKKGWFKRIFG